MTHDTLCHITQMNKPYSGSIGNGFFISEDRTKVSWQYDGQSINFTFQYPVYAHYIEYLQQILVHSDVRESGEQNLALYLSDGSLKSRPKMPIRPHKVHGIYAVWFVQGERKQQVVLLSDESKPYDTACTFDLETHRFFDFHPTY